MAKTVIICFILVFAFVFSPLNIWIRCEILFFNSTIIKKFIYKVYKSFALTEDGFKELSIISVDSEQVRGSHFAVGDIYVDYESADKSIEITTITKSLLSKNFLKLESQVDM